MKRNKFWRRQQGLKRAKRVWDVYRACSLHPRQFDPNKLILNRLYKTRKPCSCIVCGNRRRYYGRTMQERRRD